MALRSRTILMAVFISVILSVAWYVYKYRGEKFSGPDDDARNERKTAVEIVVGSSSEVLENEKTSVQGPRTLVMDLDQTMIYSRPDGKGSYYVMFRPHIVEFLRRARKLFGEVTLFTAATQSYADPIVDRIVAMCKLDDTRRFFERRMYRDSCDTDNRTGGVVKDLTRIENDTSNVVLVDDTPSTFSRQPNSGVLIRRWYGESDDQELLRVLKLLERRA